MKKNLLLLCAIVLMTGSSLRAQNLIRCGTMEYLAAQKAADPGLEARMADIERQTKKWLADNPDAARTEAVVTIPVVFHVVYNTAAQNISDAQCGYELAQLNADYARLNSDAGNTPSVFQGVAANTQIQFCLAQRDPNGNATSGVVHKSTTVSSFSSNDNVKHNANGGDDAWNRDSYLNLWICNLGGGLLGYAQFPGGAAATDGVVVHYGTVGSIAHPSSFNWSGANYNYGRSATHEIGHWLNLIHIWGDSNCGNDQVSDTPTQQTSNFGCPGFPHVTCSNGPNGDMFMNYMDYSDDNCMNIFTAGQTTRITATINGSRVSLKTSQGCVAPGGCSSPSGLNATNITQTSATLNWGSVAAASSYNIQYRQTGTSTWTSTTSSTTSKAISGLLSGTAYEFQVQSVCTGGSSAFSGSSNFTTSTPACADNYEPNNSKSTPATISINSSIVGLITPSGDNDWFTVTTVAPNTYMRVTLSNLPADYDLRLFSSSGSLLTTSQNGGTTNEVITRNVTTAATYKIRVYGSGGVSNATQCYTLTTLTSSSPLRTEGGIGSNSDYTSILSVYPNPVKDIMNLDVNSSIDGNMSVNLVDMVGRTILKVQKSGTKGMNHYEVSLKDLNKGIYFVEVNNGVDREIKKIVLSK